MKHPTASELAEMAQGIVTELRAGIPVDFSFALVLKYTASEEQPIAIASSVKVGVDKVELVRALLAQLEARR